MNESEQIEKLTNEDTACYVDYDKCKETVKAEHLKTRPEGSYLTDDEAYELTNPKCLHLDEKCKLTTTNKLNQKSEFIKLTCGKERNDYFIKCKIGCFDRYAITQEDFTALFKNKKVFGFIDSCHSGGMAEHIQIENKKFLVSAAKDELSRDAEDGGLFVKKLESFMQTKFCDSRQKQYSVKDLFESARHATQNYFIHSEIKRGAYSASQTSLLVSAGQQLDHLIINQNRKCNDTNQSPTSVEIKANVKSSQ